VQAMNNSEAFIACFADQAVVRDEGHEHRGTDAIKTWIESAFRKYQIKLEVTDTAEHEEEKIFSARVSGTFEGSPVQLRHRLTIEDSKVTSLTITPQ